MRWLWGALATSAVALSASGCGSSGATGTFTGGPIEAGIPIDATVPPNLSVDSGPSSGDEGGPSCTPRTCAQAGANCGPVADGCGGLVDCGGCGTGQSCGGGGTASVCGGAACVPKTCADPSVATLCGQQSDGCGGLIAAQCVTCVAPQTCGGGGTPNACGGVAGCVPATAGAVCVTSTGIPMNCGIMADGCGGTVTCGSGAACPAGETCGGAGDPNVCGSSTIKPLPDGGTIIVDAGSPVCTPFSLTAACTGPTGLALCGAQSDGCGTTVTCPTTCTLPATCGGGGTASVCGKPPCVPAPVCTSGGVALCGVVSDGCGSTFTCPTVCTSPQTCGGNPSTPGVCGEAPCTPLTACPVGVNCGPWPDGCGGLVNTAAGTGTCGTCTSPDICGGGGVASQCGDTPGGGTGACDAGLKCNLTECDGGATTTLSGQIFDPAGNDPLYNVVVYVPNGTPDYPLQHGQYPGDGGANTSSCPSCSSLYTGDPIVSTTTDTDGKFTLTGVPVPTTGASKGDVPIVIQVGKWRRQMIWPGVKTCGANPATAAVQKLLRLPGAETVTAPTALGATLDELPQIGVSTGSADSMECLFKRIGFSDNEYVCGWNGGAGHLHIFQGAGGQGGNVVSGCTASSPADGGLWDQANDLNNYDIVVLSCEGEETYEANPAALNAFTILGGRAFASHFHYSWFTGAPQDGNGNPAYTAPSDWGSNLATWYPSSNDICPEGTSAYGCNNTNSDSWINGTIVEQLSDGGTPFATWLANVKALDVVPAGGSGTAVAGELNIQQSRMNAVVTSSNAASQVWIVPDSTTYEYAAIGGTTTVQPLPDSSSQYFSFDTPIGGTGNPAAPYCGRVVYSDLHIGGASGDYGSSKAVPGGCSGGKLTPQEKALEYMLLDLASCVGSDTNLPNPPPTCTPLDACPAGYQCGEYPNGCGDGGFLNCGSCEGGAECVAGKCTTCTPLKACPAGTTCGDYPDGCGGSISCGPCTTGTCIKGTCVNSCTDQPCPASITCGQTGNGCGGLTALCGTCTPPASCGGGGTPGVCGESDGNACVPQPCPAGVTCGLTGDGCGGTVNCGTCVAPLTCGGGGTPGVCGAPSCTPETCASLGANCGQVADGCGGLTAVCGTCTGNATCGGGGTANSCGVPPCTPSTCTSLGVNCGDVGDGCGNVLECGNCVAPDTCGGGGTANICGTGGPR